MSLASDTSTNACTNTQDHLDVEAFMHGLVPAFRHLHTGETHLALDEYGDVATMHTFNGLPAEWITDVDDSAEAAALSPDVVAGYWRNAQFYPALPKLVVPLDD